MKLTKATCPKCGYVAAITKGGKWVRHASARGAYRLPGGPNICPNSGRTALSEAEGGK